MSGYCQGFGRIAQQQQPSFFVGSLVRSHYDPTTTMTQQQTQQFIDVSNSDIWQFSNLEITQDGYVEGYAYTQQLSDDSDISIGVTTYEYNDAGDLNYVPNVTIVADSGSIIAEPHASDSTNATTAIKNAIRQSEFCFKERQRELSE